MTIKEQQQLEAWKTAVAEGRTVLGLDAWKAALQDWRIKVSCATTRSRIVTVSACLPDEAEKLALQRAVDLGFAVREEPEYQFQHLPRGEAHHLTARELAEALEKARVFELGRVVVVRHDDLPTAQSFREIVQAEGRLWVVAFGAESSGLTFFALPKDDRLLWHRGADGLEYRVTGVVEEEGRVVIQTERVEKTNDT